MAPERTCLHWPLEFPEVFLDRVCPGFDAVVGNPPFQGGKRISGAYGTTYREHLVNAVADGRKGNADLVSYFFLRAAQVVRRGGTVGLLATNTIAQGDTREVGLDWLTASGWTISRAVKSRRWPGGASLEIAQVWLFRGQWNGPVTLDGFVVTIISPTLDPVRQFSGHPFRLTGDGKRVFQGSVVLGVGFTVNPQDAEQMITEDDRYADILFPYLSGEDVTSHPSQQASRYIINFHDWPLERARQYPRCLEIVEREVRPIREQSKRRQYRERWWQFAERQKALYEAIEGLQRVLVIAQVSKVVQPVFVSMGQVLAMMLNVFVYEDYARFAILTSAFHWWWAITQASTLETRIRYAPSDCFDTFPQPLTTPSIETAGLALDTHRRQLMLDRWEGLTATYNRVHNPKEETADIAELRRLHVALDHAVAAAYGWEDLELDHDFWETRQGIRFTVSPDARGELLDRLLELNHARYAEEVRSGLHSGKNSLTVEPKAARRRSSSTSAMFEVDP
jgi:hypothetical protein